MKYSRIFLLFFPVALLLFSGCASKYIGKNRQEIVDIIAQEYNKSPEDIFIHIPQRRSNYVFNKPSEILDENRNWGADMRNFDQWGILPYKKFLYDGSFFTLLTFKDDIVVKEEEIYGGGYGFKPLGFVFLLIAPLFL